VWNIIEVALINKMHAMAAISLGLRRLGLLVTERAMYYVEIRIKKGTMAPVYRRAPKGKTTIKWSPRCVAEWVRTGMDAETGDSKKKG
jgi:hypothetical protein